MKGKLKVSLMREYFITCVVCGLQDVMHYDTMNMKKAEKEFRDIGWRMRGGKWHCIDCVDKLSTV